MLFGRARLNPNSFGEGSAERDFLSRGLHDHRPPGKAFDADEGCADTQTEPNALGSERIILRE